MTKEELIKNQFPNDEFLQSAVLQIVDKCIAELEEKISILLSCKNCPENKGGLLCQKEYEDKCLTQKIQYIKELKEENAEMEAQIEKMAIINPGSYEFKSICNVMDFVKPLLMESYPVAINTVYKEFPRENDIDKFTVDVGKKGCKISIYDPDKKSEVN